MATSNLDRLVEARVIPAPENLTQAERAVIDGLSAEEVDTLVGIRRKLSAAASSAAADRPAGLADFDPDLDLKSNVVI